MVETTAKMVKGPPFSWHCPSCKRSLQRQTDHLFCTPCDRQYEMIGEIPDLRVEGASWIDRRADLKAARVLWEQSLNMGLEELVRSVYSAQPGRDERSIQLRTRQLMEGPTQKRKDFEGWLLPYASEPGLLMDLGCGGGSLIAGAALCGYQGIGIDVSMTWLVIAHKLIKEWGGEPILAAAMAEHLPLADESISGVISFDVIEHVDDPASYLMEINRVVSDRGRVLLTTPNRFSITAEPHVFIWGVGWLPRRFQKSFVKWRNGMNYEFTRLLSSLELMRLLERNTDFDFKIQPGSVPESEISHFKPLRKVLATLYNRIQSLPLIRVVFLAIGPFFCIYSTRLRRTSRLAGDLE